jgi:hypothetical protein
MLKFGFDMQRPLEPSRFLEAAFWFCSQSNVRDIPFGFSD